jgi:hypothetical protein
MQYQNQKLFLVWLLFSVVHSNAMERNHGLNTPNSVSFIYYPSGRECPNGHAELEIEGDSWTLLTDQHYGKKCLQDMIGKSTQDGWPFFRFLLNAEQSQIEKMRDIIAQKRAAYNCSRAALAPLAEAGICSVPLLFNASPLLAAAYLMAGQKLGLNNVQKIEYYGNPSMKQSIAKMLVGASIEVGMVASVGFCCYVGWQVSQCLQEDNPALCLGRIL